MTQRAFKISLILTSFAVLGLILVQLYWIDNAVKLKQNEFNRIISDVLKEVVDDVEKQEAVNKIRSHQQGKFLFFDTDSISSNVAVPDTGYDVMLLREIRKENNQVEISIVEERNGQKQERTIVKSVEKGENDSLLEIIEDQMTFKMSEIDDYNANIEKASSQVDSILKKRVRYKTAVVGDIVKSLIEVDIYESVNDRILKTELVEKLIKKFADNGISSEMLYGVFNDKKQVVVTNAISAADLSVLENTKYKVRLFPNDVIGKTNYLKVYFPGKTSYVLTQMWSILLLSLLVLAFIIIGFAFTFNTILKQKKVSEMKNDFINNMTHELKTPISTISLACQALTDDTINSQEFTSRYVSMIGEENKRLGVLVENVLQSAIFDKGDFKLKLESVNLNELVKQAAKNIEFQIKDKEGRLSMELNEQLPIIKLDKVHFINIISNLIDNANKYSKEAPAIDIRTELVKENIEITVSDNGIGISKENQKRVFEKLYRVPTGNLHDNKGFGLGLSYVKTIVEKHNGIISVNSELGKGSQFKIIIPTVYE